MKKSIKSLLVVTMAAMLAFGAAACGKETVNAYDVAVQNGFVGTEEEWLRSLHGANGKDGEDLDAEEIYQTAVQNGYTGSFLEFCKELQITMPEKNNTKQIAENMCSVVSVYCGYSVTKTSGGGMFGGGRPTSTVEYGSQAGSGVIVELNKEAGSALIITNYHVLYNLSSDQAGILEDIWIYTYGSLCNFDPSKTTQSDGGIKARFVGGAMDYDIAILKVEGSEALQNSQAAEAVLGNSEQVVVGEETYAIGNPAGAGIAVTNGILSVDSEYIGISALDNRDVNPRDGYVDTVAYRVMRTSAAINSGNSGGGMFNTKGELIGIVNAKSGGTQTDNMGYALPITQVKAVYDNILANEGKVKQATLGVIVELKNSKAVLSAEGVLSLEEEFCVAEIENDAAAAGKLSVGDVFLSITINGQEHALTRKHQLIDWLLTVRVEDKVEITVRNSSGDRKTVEIPFEEKDFKIYA